jgi:hypothetical protein
MDSWIIPMPSSINTWPWTNKSLLNAVHTNFYQLAQEKHTIVSQGGEYRIESSLGMRACNWVLIKCLKFKHKFEYMNSVSDTDLLRILAVNQMLYNKSVNSCIR